MMLNIALPKGRLGDKALGMFCRAGFPCPDMPEGSRALALENPDAGVRFFLVKPWDVPVYVENGVADIGVAGKDTLLENGADLYELMDLGIGRCRMAVAGRPGQGAGAQLRVATKFPVITRQYYSGRGINTRIIKLHGSIELAPILGLSDVIVDIVESGATLRENGLAVLEEIMPISARLVANKAASKFKAGQIDRIAAGLAKVIGEDMAV